jgi:hypothetical protein
MTEKKSSDEDVLGYISRRGRRGRVGEVGRGLEVALSGIVKDIYYCIEQRKTTEKTR